MKKANWIHVEYGNSRSALFLEARRRIKDALDVEVESIVVQNDKTSDIDLGNSIRGSNTLREFSGWNEGVSKFLQQSPNRPDWWIFSNDTFFSHRYFWGAIFRGFVDTSISNSDPKTPLVIGDVLSSTMLYGDSPRYPYVSTYFFMVSELALARINYDLCSGAPLNWICETSDLRVETDTCPESVASFLGKHLLDPKSKLSWYGAENLSTKNVLEMRFKAKAIILEHNLSRRFSESGVVFAPIFNRSGINFQRIRRALESRFEKLAFVRERG